MVSHQPVSQVGEMIGDRHKVPHHISVTKPVTSEKYVSSYRANQPLHFWHECKTPFCSHHMVYGNTAESCALDMATYANVAWGQEDEIL